MTSMGNGAAAQKVVDVCGVRTKYLEQGQGPAVLLLLHNGLFSHDGVCCNSMVWEKNIGSFAQEFRVIAVDTMGQGGTALPADPGHFTYDAVVAHVDAFLQAIGIGQAHLIGHDHGAMIALLLALRRPALVRSCVVINAAAIAPAGDAVPNLTLTGALRPLYSRPSQAWVLRRQSYSPNHVSEGEFLDLAEQTARSDEFKTGQARLASKQMQLQLLRSSNKARLEVFVHLREHGIAVPTMVLWSTHDPMTSADYVHQWGTSRDSNSSIAFARSVFDLIQNKQPLTRLCLIAHAGYYPYREQPKVFNQIVAAFARSIEMTSGRAAHVHSH